MWKRLAAFGLNTDAVWDNICQLVVKSLVVVDDRMTHQPCCFEVFGYDVLIDQNLRPWLIEVNASPSLARENALDSRVKEAMVRDTILLLDVPPFDRAAVARILKRRLNDMRKSRASCLVKNDPDLEADLRDILGDFVPRRYGEQPRTMGDFQLLCPNTPMFAAALKLRSKIMKTNE